MTFERPSSEMNSVSPAAAGETLAAKRKPVSLDRNVEILQDLPWEEAQAAAKFAAASSSMADFRENLAVTVFPQPSRAVRERYAQYFVKWFLPSLTLDEPCVTVWRAFKDDAALRHVMRWQYVTSNPLIAEFVDGQLSSAQPGEPVDDLADTFLIGVHGTIKEKTRVRLRTNLRKVGFTVQEHRVHYRIIPDVSIRALVVLITHLFAREPRVVTWTTLVNDPWWRRLGVLNESVLRMKLKEAESAGLIERFRQMDTLDQITTRYSIKDLQDGIRQ